MELLVAAGANLHIKNGKSMTAVGTAANNGHAEAVLKLVSHGAAWRNLPDLNVVRTICRKTNYKCALLEAVRRSKVACGMRAGFASDLLERERQAEAVRASLLFHFSAGEPHTLQAKR